VNQSLIPLLPEVLSAWNACYSGFATAEADGQIRRKLVEINGHPLSLVFGAVSATRTPLPVLARYNDLLLLPRDNWSFHFGQIVAIPRDAYDGESKNYAPRDYLTIQDLQDLFELIRTWRWPALLSLPGSGASVPERIHYQFYPPTYSGVRTFPLIEKSLENTVVTARLTGEGIIVSDVVLHPCPTLLVEATEPVRDTYAHLLHHLCDQYHHGASYNLLIRTFQRGFDSGIQTVFLPRRLSARGSEYPAEPLNQLSDDWKWGAPEVFGCLHLRQNGMKISRLLTSEPHLLSESMRKMSGDMGRVKELLREYVRLY
jgi:hypothetical protein